MMLLLIRKVCATKQHIFTLVTVKDTEYYFVSDSGVINSPKSWNTVKYALKKALILKSHKPNIIFTIENKKSSQMFKPGKCTILKAHF